MFSPPSKSREFRSPVAMAAIARAWQATAQLTALVGPPKASPARTARLVSFSYAPTPLHSAPARRTRPKTPERAPSCCSIPTPLHCGKLPRLANTPGGVSAASFCSSGAGQGTAPPTQNCPPSLPPPKLVAHLRLRVPGLGLALTPPPLSASRPEPSTLRLRSENIATPAPQEFPVSAASSGYGSRACEPVPPQGGELLRKIENGVRLPAFDTAGRTGSPLRSVSKAGRLTPGVKLVRPSNEPDG